MSEWIKHPEFTDYEFSISGMVRVTKNGKEKPLVGTKCGAGYRAIDFRSNNANKKREYIHRVVCFLFNGPPAANQQCRHLDGNILNNAASNLAWGTAAENANDKKLHGTLPFGEKNPMARLTRSDVEAMRETRITKNKPYHLIAKEYGVSTMTAYRAVTNQSWNQG